jgi:hypothetical protein
MAVGFHLATYVMLLTQVFKLHKHHHRASTVHFCNNIALDVSDTVACHWA